MRRIQYLHKNRFGIYCFRYTYPKSYVAKHPSLPKTIHLSLKTRNKAEASKRVVMMWLKVQAFMDEDFADERTDEEKIASHLRYYRFLMKMADDPYDAPNTKFNPLEYSDEVDFVAHQLWSIQKAGLLNRLDEEFSNKEVLFEKAEQFLKDQSEAQIDAELSRKLDMVRDVSSVSSQSTQVVAKKAPVTTSNSAKHKLSDFLDMYIAEKSQDADWADKTRLKIEGHFHFLIQTVGNKEVSCFTRADVVKYMDALRAKKHKRYGILRQLSATAKNDYLATCKRVFGYCIERVDGVLANPFEGTTLKFEDKANKRRKRLPFSSDQLKALFSQPTHVQGYFKYPYEYWIPLLGLYTGARANDLCQLHLDDVYEEEIGDQKVWCISINDDTPDKRLKTGHKNIVPLHPRLIELGFDAFVELKKKRPYKIKDENGYYRLFDGLTYTKQEGYRKNFSRWFNGTDADKIKGRPSFKQSVGIESCDKYLLDFHSFRHTCATALENAGVSNSISFRITGHALDSSVEKFHSSAGGGYRHGLEVKTKHDAISQLDFSNELINVKPFFDVCDKKRLRPKIKL